MVFRKKKEKLIVSKKEIEKEYKEDKSKGKHKDIDEEPNWYHYIIVLLILVGILGGLYAFFEIYDRVTDNGKKDNPNINIDIYKYEFEENGRSGTFEFYNPIDDINEFDYPIEITKFDFLNSEDIYLSFLEYNGSDNGEVVRTSGRFPGLLKSVYRFNFDVNEHLVLHNETNCSHASVEKKVVVFNPYSDKNGVFYNGNGCIEFLTDDPVKMRDLGDKFFLSLFES